MVSQQENSKRNHCRNSCFSQLCRMGTKGNAMGKFLVFCLDISPRFHTQRNSDKLQWIHRDGPRGENCECAVCREGTRGHRRAVCWDPKTARQRESRISSVNTRNLTEYHWEQLQGDSSKVKVKQLLWREHVYSKKKMSLEIKTGLFLEPSSGHFVVENSNAKLIILWAWISNF